MLDPVSPRTRARLIVVAAAVAAASATVGATLLYDDADGGTRARKGAPPLLLDLGARDDEQAKALRRAESLYDRGRRDEAAAIFERFPRTLEAEAGAALARWPRSSTRALEALAREHPRSAFARLHVGLARYWEGELAAAQEAWREAERVEPDSLSAIRAEDLLHPEFARGRPAFTPSFPLPRHLRGLPLPEVVAALERRGHDVRSLLYLGVAEQRLGRPVSARKAYDRAARLAPDDPEALTAAAVARFDKDDPAAAFSRIGPLSRRFPGAATVRYHLGLLLLWTGRVREGKRQLGLVKRSPLEMEAKRLLVRLAKVK
jgi:tetratricopeptide (TPR) repeat protein